VEEAKDGFTAGRPSVAKFGGVAGSQDKMLNERLGEELVIRVVSVQDEDRGRERAYAESRG
jgi:hypothetical protein